MFTFAAKFAAALSVTAALSAQAFAAPTVVVEDQTIATVAGETIEVAVYCEYVILWDAWGNAYYEYYCY